MNVSGHRGGGNHNTYNKSPQQNCFWNIRTVVRVFSTLDINSNNPLIP